MSPWNWRSNANALCPARTSSRSLSSCATVTRTSRSVRSLRRSFLRRAASGRAQSWLSCRALVREPYPATPQFRSTGRGVATPTTASRLRAEPYPCHLSPLTTRGSSGRCRAPARPSAATAPDLDPVTPALPVPRAPAPTPPDVAASHRLRLVRATDGARSREASRALQNAARRRHRVRSTWKCRRAVRGRPPAAHGR